MLVQIPLYYSLFYAGEPDALRGARRGSGRGDYERSGRRLSIHY